MSEKIPESEWSDCHAVDPDKPLSTCACVHCELGRANKEVERLKAENRGGDGCVQTDTKSRKNDARFT